LTILTNSASDVIYTENGMESMIEECFKVGADGHLSKPFFPSVYEVLLNALTNAKFKFYEHFYWKKELLNEK